MRHELAQPSGLARGQWQLPSAGAVSSSQSTQSIVSGRLWGLTTFSFDYAAIKQANIEPEEEPDATPGASMGKTRPWMQLFCTDLCPIRTLQHIGRILALPAAASLGFDKPAFLLAAPAPVFKGPSSPKLKKRGPRPTTSGQFELDAEALEFFKQQAEIEGAERAKPAQDEEAEPVRFNFHRWRMRAAIACMAMAG